LVLFLHHVYQEWEFHLLFERKKSI
jgi:hypothetical protein